MVPHTSLNHLFSRPALVRRQPTKRVKKSHTLGLQKHVDLIPKSSEPQCLVQIQNMNRNHPMIFFNINNQPIDFRLNLDLHNDFHSSRLGMPGTSPGTPPGTPWQAGSGSRRFSPSFKHNRITENINWITNLTGYTVIGYDKIFSDILESLTTPFDDLWRLLFVSLCLGDTAKRGDSGGDPPHKAGGPGIALSTLGWSFRVLFWGRHFREFWGLLWCELNSSSGHYFGHLQ